MKKIKLMPMVLVFVLLLSVILSPGLEVFAYTYTISYGTQTTSDGMFDYSVSNGEVTIEGLVNSHYSGPLNLPSKVRHEGKWLPVTEIDSFAFSECKGLTGSLTIPKSVKVIGSYAFKDCSSFTGTLTIPYGVQTIGDVAFAGCSSLSGSLTIPNSVTTIGERAFSECSAFAGSLKLSNKLLNIGDSAFKGCSSLTGSLAIPSSVVNIGSYAFKNCSSLTGPLIIPDNVVSIGNDAFSGCSGFTSLILPKKIKNLSSWVFYGCSGLSGTLTIPSGVQSIGDYAFYNCIKLKVVHLPEKLNSIGSQAFNGPRLSTVISWAKVAPSLDYNVFSYEENTNLITPNTPASDTSYRSNAEWLSFRRQALNVSSLKVTKSPTKIHYINGENLNLTGGQLLVNASNPGVGSFTIPLSNAEVNGFNSNSKVYGPQTITVEYGGATTSFKVYLNIFKDVPYGHDFYSTIRNIVSKGVMRGKGDGQYFGPADKLTRAEASVALIRAAGLEPARGSAFSDVPRNHWANAYINAAAKAGIVNGKGPGRFAPNDNITRAELAVMVSRAFKLQKDSSNVTKFRDVPSNYWAYNFIQNLTSNGIVGGYPDGRFGPDDPVTRGQFTVFVSKSMNK